MTSKPVLLRFKFDDFDQVRGKPRREEGSAGEENDGDEEERLMGFYLFNVSGGDVDASHTIIIRDAGGDIFREGPVLSINRFTTGAAGKGWRKAIAKRLEIVDETNDVLVDGALLVDVELRFKPESTSSFSPPHPLAKNMLALLDNHERADVAFKF
ncbi:hypothetical protein ACHAXT_001370 [Thalassiosira profunda]